MKCVFALSTGRSGTRFLYELARRNLADAFCRHETSFDWHNPPMFGPAIDAHRRGDLVFLRSLLERKRRFVESLRSSVYFESSHAFLKSYYDLAPEYFADIKVFHLVRDPLKTALSEANRERMVMRIHWPRRRYRAPDGGSYFRWALTGQEPIYASFADWNLSLFQHYLIQWIEIQNRAVEFLDRFDKHADCVTLESPRELNEPHTVAAAFAALGLETRWADVKIGGNHNHTPGYPTLITQVERDEASRVLEHLPECYFEVFRRPLFARFSWTESLLNRTAQLPSREASPIALPKPVR